MNQLSRSIFGYNPTQTDQLLKEQQEKINRLEQQITELEEQLASYVEMEDLLKESIVDARMRGNEILDESHVKANQLIDRTNHQVYEYKSDIANQGTGLVEAGQNLQDQLIQMKQNMQDILAKFQSELDSTDFKAYFPKDSVATFKLHIDELEGVHEMEPTVNQSKDTINNQNPLTREEKANLKSIIHEVMANEELNDQTETVTSNLKVVK